MSWRRSIRENGLVSGNAAVASTFLAPEENRPIAETALDEHKSATAATEANENFMTATE